MKQLSILFFFACFFLSAQTDKKKTEEVKAQISQYKIFTIAKDSSIVDTSLTIQDDYAWNYLRKDAFGLLPFANEGYLYTQLDFTKKTNSIYPQFGFAAKHQYYLNSDDIKYYSVPTPLTDLYFKTVMRQGQSFDGTVTLNTNRNLNFALSYKSVRSIGDYLNQLSSNGHFRFSSNYNTKNKKYFLKAHLTSQDLYNQENGGVSNLLQLNGSTNLYNDRERIDVNFLEGSSKLSGNRIFIDHSYKLKENNALFIKHQAYYEVKFYELLQTPQPLLDTSTTGLNQINNKTRDEVFYNKFGVGFTTKKYGDLYFFIDNFNNNYYYPEALPTNVPYSLHNQINSLGAAFQYNSNKWKFNASAQNSISVLPTSNFNVTAQYSFSDAKTIKFIANQQSKLPNNSFQLHQSQYVAYNWSKSFTTEKETSLQIDFKSNWVNLIADFKRIDDFLYFNNTSLTKLTIAPFQFNSSITYSGLQIQKEFKFRKFRLDNTIKYQNVFQNEKILNLPQFITRNTLYYTDNAFKNAMQFQTGVAFNMFTKYFANNYNAVIGDLYTQSTAKIGGFPMVDLFFNARVRQTRIYFRLEHINTFFQKNITYFNTPNYPYHDFKFRFGLEWNFFK